MLLKPGRPSVGDLKEFVVFGVSAPCSLVVIYQQQAARPSETLVSTH